MLTLSAREELEAQHLAGSLVGPAVPTEVAERAADPRRAADAVTHDREDYRLGEYVYRDALDKFPVFA